MYTPIDLVISVVVTRSVNQVEIISSVRELGKLWLKLKI